MVTGIVLHFRVVGLVLHIHLLEEVLLPAEKLVRRGKDRDAYILLQ
jgi:hypothetical protein